MSGTWPSGSASAERSLLDHIRRFLLELGQGFAFLGSQYHLALGDEAYFLDLLFYHIRLRCCVVIDLKIGSFQAEHAGKMNFYPALPEKLRGSLPTVAQFEEELGGRPPELSEWDTNG